MGTNIGSPQIEDSIITDANLLLVYIMVEEIVHWQLDLLMY
jgi:hypothetical protein